MFGYTRNICRFSNILIMFPTRISSRCKSLPGAYLINFHQLNLGDMYLLEFILFSENQHFSSLIEYPNRGKQTRIMLVKVEKRRTRYKHKDCLSRSISMLFFETHQLWLSLLKRMLFRRTLSD